MNKNCVLIGGSGFLGLNIANALLKAGHNVTIADIKPPSAPGFKEVAGKVKFYQVD